MLFILRRVVLMVPVLLGVTFLTFVVTKFAPGDPALLMLGNYATPERVAEVRAQLGLDDPLLVQYVRYVGNTLRGNFGTSIRSQRPVIDEIWERLPSTAELALGGLFFSALIGIPVGVAAAATRRRWLSGLVMTGSVLGLSIPSFWLAVLGLIVFGVNLHWITVMGGEGVKDLILPSLCLGLGEGAVLARLTYATVSETLLADYVRTARAKGLSSRWVLWRHALRNALIPILTVVGLQVGNLLSGSIFMEAVFARPGLGRYAINAINNRDFPQIQGMVLFTALVYVLVNLGVDIAYAWADPPDSLMDATLPRTAARLRPQSRFTAAWTKLRGDPFGLLGLALFVVIVGGAVLAPLVAPYSPIALDYKALNKPPQAAHLMGTDQLGRDLFSRVIWGGRESLRVSFLATLIGVSGGLVLGMISGYFGGWLDELIQRLVEVLMAFPMILFLLTIIAALGPGLETLLVAAGIATIPTYTRLIRGSVLSIRGLDYVVASRALGATERSILLRHVLPNILPLALTYAALGVGSIILATAGLGYIGLGAQPPSPEWGAMLNAGRTYVSTAWWLSFFPGAAIFLAVLSINLLGESLRQILDPRLR